MVKVIRPLPESLLEEFRIKLGSTDFSALNELNVDEAVTSSFQTSSTQLLTSIFPEKKIIIYGNDKP